MAIKPRCGSRIYKGLEIPESAMLHVNANGREFYLTGSSSETGLTEIRYTDDGYRESITSTRLETYAKVQDEANRENWKQVNQKLRAEAKTTTPTPGQQQKIEQIKLKV